MWAITKTPPISFHVHEATPTTISYKVSTSQRTSSHTGKLLHYAAIALRIMLGSYYILVCWILIQKLLNSHTSATINGFVASSLVLNSAWTIVYNLPLQYLFVILIICFWLVIRRGYKGNSYLITEEENGS